MSVLAWTLLVIAGFIGSLFVLKAWNKDTSGAVQIAVAIIVIAFLALSVGCSVSPERAPWLEAGFAYERSETVGSNPACVVRLRQPVGFGPLEPDWLILGYVHHSSCRDQLDKATVDQIELVAKIPLGRRK